MKRRLLILVLFTLPLFLNGQTLDFAKTFGSVNGDEIRDITVDPVGNIYVAGAVWGTTDFDPGPGVFNAAPTNIACDAFIAKYDQNGNFLWVKVMNGNYASRVRSIGIDGQGNILTTGSFSGVTDFNPGAGVNNLTCAGGDDIFVSKLDSSGNYVWAKRIGNSDYDGGASVKIQPNNSIIITGGFRNTVDFDPGAGTSNLTATGTDDVFILKLYPNGSFGWAKRIGGNQFTQVWDMDLGPNNSIYITGDFYGTTDFNPGAGTFNLTAGGFDDPFIAKLDSSGNLGWAINISGSETSIGSGLETDLMGNVFATGWFQGTADFDPGAGVLPLISNGYNDFYTIKLDANGNLDWAKTVGGSMDDESYGITIDNAGRVYVSGLFGANTDFDPGFGIDSQNVVGQEDLFLTYYDASGNYLSTLVAGSTGDEKGLRLAYNNGSILSVGNFENTIDLDPGIGTSIHTSLGYQDDYFNKIILDSCIGFTLVLDSVNNVGCSNLGYAQVHTINGNGANTYSWNTTPPQSSAIANFDTAGIYQVIVTDGLGCTKSSSILIEEPLVSGIDLNANIVASTFHSGFNTYLWVDGFNDGCTNQSGTIKLKIDTNIVTNLVFLQSPPNIIQADTLIWFFNPVNFDSAHFTPFMEFITSPSASIGDIVHFELSITPSFGDMDTTNNFKSYDFPVVNGYDPNDKKIYPAGECYPGFILNDQTLTYTIRFQNTGNADAINIYILDTLDNSLDINSVRIIGNSDPVITEVLPGNVLKFRFDNIMLPDSNANEPLSHGYVIFEVVPDTGIANNTPIDNTSHIFFDFNPPITTNTVNNILVSSIPNSNSSVTQNFCNSTVINGYTYNTSGTFIQYLDNYLGCDSVITLNLTMLDSSSSNLFFSNCYSYTLNSTTYYSSGIYNQTLTNALGCDSLITLHLTILDSTSNIITSSACDSYTLNSITYNSSGMYSQTFTNSVGCDSTLYLDLTINTIDNSVSQSGYILTAQQTSATYQWIDCNNSNQPIFGETNQSFTATANGDYAVIVTANGCTDTSACQTVFGFGIEDQNLSSGLSASPNPTTSLINLSSKIELKNATIVVTDINGKNLIQKNQLNGTNFPFDLSELKAGMYFFHIYSEGKEGVIKVVKE